MATHLTSDTFYNISCPLCSDVDNNREASVYCVNCDQFFCKSCLKGHNGVPGAKQHQFVHKADFQHGVPQFAIATSSYILPRRCRWHKNRFTDKYCRCHDRFGCGLCHESCSDVFDIHDVAASMIFDNSIHEVKQGLSEYIRDLSRLKQDRLDHKARLQNEKETTLTQTDERMNAIIQHVRTLGTAFRQDIMDRYERFTDKLNDDERFCDRSIEKFELMDTRLQTPVLANASQSFVDLKLAEVLMKEVRVKMGQCERERIDLMKITFRAGNDVRNVVTEEMFGRLYGCLETPIVGTSACYITDLCALPNGTIIITNYSNKKLNLLQYEPGTYRVSDFLSLSGSPWGVCSLGGNTVAVTVPDQLRILVVTVGQPMGIMSTFPVDHKCYGIAYADSCLYISHYYESQLSVYDVQGKLLQTISEDHNRASLFVRPQHLCVLPRHGHIAVADRDKGVVVINMSGNPVTRYTYPNMKHTMSVCVDGRGTMYIADSGSKNIVVLGVDNSVTSLSFRLPAYPLLVTYDAHTNTLMARPTVQGNNHIYTFFLDN